VRRPGGPAVRRSVLIVAAIIMLAGSAHAQDTLTARPPDRPTVDSLAAGPPDTLDPRPTTPMGAMFRSFLLPGWGQAVYGRKVTAGVMLGIEGLALGMVLKTSSELEHIRSTGSNSDAAKLQEREDWMAILIFNHLMSGLEAYVSAHLYDFPADIQLQALPRGGMRLGVTLPLGGR
jgi:hypothetical protein